MMIGEVLLLPASIESSVDADALVLFPVQDSVAA